MYMILIYTACIVFMIANIETITEAIIVHLIITLYTGSGSVSYYFIYTNSLFMKKAALALLPEEVQHRYQEK